MNRQQKALKVGSLTKDFMQSSASFVVGVKGLSVNQMESLRGQLRANDSVLRVAKARLMKLAVQGEAHDAASMLEPFFKEQIALVFARNEVSPVAKVLHEFSKANGALSLIAGCYEHSLLAADDVVRIASLPPREVLLAQLCGTLSMPMRGLVQVLNVLVLRLLWVLKRLEEKKQQEQA